MQNLRVVVKLDTNVIHSALLTIVRVYTLYLLTYLTLHCDVRTNWHEIKTQYAIGCIVVYSYAMPPPSNALLL